MKAEVGNEYRCRFCGYRWISRIQGQPRCCPSCKRYHWKAAQKKVSA